MNPPPNLFGADLAGLDVPAFLSAARLVFPWLALGLLGLVFWRRRASWLLVGVLAANAFAWAVTNYPLQRLYALGVGRDRVSNLALVQVVAAGGSPLDTWQVGQSHLSRHGRPHHILWGALMAALSGWSPDRMLALYGWVPLLVLWAFVLALYWGFRPPRDALPAGASTLEGWSAAERALLAGGATLLCASPLDFTSPYGPAWSMTFLLKPNHALGLVLFPFVLRACARSQGLRGRLATALLLHLLGWAFALHVVYVAWGLAVFAALSWWTGPRESRRRDLLDALVPLAVNGLLTAPFIVRLVADRLARVSDPHSALPPLTSHLLEPTARAGIVFLLGAWGAWVAHQRGDRLGRLLAAQFLGALSIWAAYAGLAPLGLVEQPDEIEYWLRILTGALAGVGLWDLSGRVAAHVRALAGEPARQAAAAALCVLPWTLPYWWDPGRMDRYFEGSRVPLPDTLRETGEFLRHRTAPRAVLAAEPEFAWWMAALGARRSMLAAGLYPAADYRTRLLALGRIVSAEDGAGARAAAATYGVTHLVVTPPLLASHGVALSTLDARPDLRRVHLSGDPSGDFAAVYELRAGQPRVNQGVQGGDEERN